MSIPCHICGYHPGSELCSAAHELPRCHTPLDRYQSNELDVMMKERDDSRKELYEMTRQRDVLTEEHGDWERLARQSSREADVMRDERDQLIADSASAHNDRAIAELECDQLRNERDELRADNMNCVIESQRMKIELLKHLNWDNS